MIKPALQSGLSGMQTAYQGMAQSATDIARLNSQSRDAGIGINAALTGSMQPLLDLRVNLTFFDASANVVSAADSMTGSLLDVTV